MKILHVMWTLGLGGIERLVLDLGKAQIKAGHSPSVLVGQAKGEFAYHFASEGIPVIAAGVRRGYQPVIRERSRILKAMRAANVIHMHAYNPYFARLAKRSRTPIVYTDHGNNALGRNRTLPETILFPLRDRFMARSVDYLTFNSNYTKARFAERVGLSQVQNTVVYNGVDFDISSDPTNAAKPDLPFDPETHFIVGTTSRFAAFKRVDRLIDAFAAMKEKERARLLLVGDGPIRADLEAQAVDAGVSEQVLFTGYQTPIDPYQNAMDVCVFPSEGEPFGLVAVETLARGKPTLVMADGGGILEIVKPIEPNDVADNIDALSARLDHYYRLWKDGALVDSNAVKARQERACDFGVEAMADAFETIYRARATGARSC